MRALILAAALLASPPAPASDPAPASGIVLISIDDLRQDHLGSYGYARATSPKLDEFSRGATRYDRHFSASGWTLPSHMSIMTSMLPSDHGVVAQPKKTAAPDEPRLPTSIRTLAEVLRGDGYATAAFVAANNLRPNVGFDRGFDVYSLNHRASAASQIRAAIAWLDAHASGKFFLFLHLYDIHWMLDDQRPGGRPFFSCEAPEGDLFRSSTVAVTSEDLLRDEPPSETQLRSLVASYDGCILSTDKRLGEFFGALKTRKRFDPSLIVVTADHGENLGEWGYFSHLPTLNPVLIHVPLIVKMPGQRTGAVRTELTSSLDVMPTVLAAAGSHIDPALTVQMGGIRLMEDGDRIDAKRAVFSEDTRKPVRAVVADDGRELVEDLSRGKAFLYDYRALTRLGPFPLKELPPEAGALRHVLDEKYRDYPGN